MCPVKIRTEKMRWTVYRFAAINKKTLLSSNHVYMSSSKFVSTLISSWSTPAMCRKLRNQEVDATCTKKDFRQNILTKVNLSEADLTEEELVSEPESCLGLKP